MATPRVPHPTEILTVSFRDACAMTGLSDPTLQREVAAGRIEVIRVGLKRMVTMRSLRKRFTPEPSEESAA
jgi:hypothetical protein